MSLFNHVDRAEVSAGISLAQDHTPNALEYTGSIATFPFYVYKNLPKEADDKRVLVDKKMADTPRSSSYGDCGRAMLDNSTPQKLSAVPKNILTTGSITTGTDSEDTASEWAPSPSANASATKPKSTAKKPAKRVATSGSGSESAEAKAPLKRERGKANEPSAKSQPAKKRVRMTPTQREAPTAQNELPLENGELALFTTTIFIVELGQQGRRFHVHESALNRSPKLREIIEKAKLSKRSSKQNTLTLVAHNEVAFEQMLQYLYKDRFTLSKSKSTATARIKEVLDLFNVAFFYKLPGLQKQIVKILSASKILYKVTAAQFFDWAEDMFGDELDQGDGPFKNYFAQVAPLIVRNLRARDLAEVYRMVGLGGPFAVEVFKACNAALMSHTTIKSEPEAEGEGSSANETSANDESLFMP